MIRLFRFLTPFRASILIVFVLVFLQCLANLYLPTLMADIVNNGIVKGNTTYILQVGGVMLLVTLVGTVCAIAGSFYSARVAIGFGRLIRTKLFTRVGSYSLHEIDTVGTASLITRTTNDTNQVQLVLVIILNMMISAPLMIIGGLILAFGQDAALTLLLLIVIPILVALIVLIMRAAIPLFRVLQSKLDRLNLILDEGLSGVRVIRAFDRIEHERERFDVANSDLKDVAIRVNRIVAFLMPTLMLVFNLTSIAILWFGAIRINNGDMQFGALFAFLQYAVLILFSLLMLSMLFIMLPRAAASADRINEVLDLEAEINDAAVVKESAGEGGYITFQNVTFSYPGAEEPALQDISFSARPGQVTAIIGGTGSGKSTLINLIPRFYDVDSGSILVDGVDVRDMGQAYLRAKIGLVPQQAVLFSGTVAQNIRYGKESATDEEVRHAAETAQAAEFIDEMPDGYDSIISQGGVNVSGGQKQRLSIARALVKRPEIYLFDDSFSALDFKTDARLRAALKRETRDATVLIVSQRVSTVMDADQIIVLDDGRIAGIGAHHDLMATNQIYYEIVSSQLSLEEIA
jgi:ATP-binding cassette subfamily B multidrug efflux pump